MKQPIKMKLMVFLVIASCIISCIILAKVYFICILGITCFLTPNAQTIVPDSIAIHVRFVEAKRPSAKDYITSLFDR